MTSISAHDIVKVEVEAVYQCRAAKDCPDHDTRKFRFTDDKGNFLEVTIFGAPGALGLSL